MQLLSRGSGILAGITVMALLGTLSIFLSSYGGGRDSFVAATAVATSAKSPTQDKLVTTCKPGFDYDVTTDQKGKTSLTPVRIAGCDCSTGDSCAHKRSEEVQSCKQWTCETWYCKKDENGTCEWQQAMCKMLPQVTGNNTGGISEGGMCATVGDTLNAEKQVFGEYLRQSDTGATPEKIPFFKEELDNCAQQFGFDSDACVGPKKDLEVAQAKVSTSALDEILKAGEVETVCETPGVNGCFGPPATPVPRNPGGGTGGLGNGGGSGVPGGFGGGQGGSRNPYQNQNTFSGYVDEFECQIQASPTQLQRSSTQTQGQPVQLQWQTAGGTTQNPPYRANIYGVGTVGPYGSATVYPNQTTTYTMTVQGYAGGSAQCEVTVTVSSQNPYGTGTDGRSCAQPPAQPPQISCSAGMWKAVSATGNGCVTGWQCVPSFTSVPVAEIKCEPQSVDVGMDVGLVWGCSNASSTVGVGFDTEGAFSGATTTTITATTTPRTFSLSCGSPRGTSTASCNVQVFQPFIVFVSSPERIVSGTSAHLGWITTGAPMQSCRISSPDIADFTTQHMNDTAISGVLRTPPLTSTTRFVLTCMTEQGSVRVASTSVSIL